MNRLTFQHRDFLDAALTIAARDGPLGVTVSSITGHLKAPAGSFYHRFASRDALLAELWLRTVLAFQESARVAMDAQDWLGAALHTPKWVRNHIDESRLLLLYHRDDFLKGEWPNSLREAVARETKRIEAGTRKFAKGVFGDSSAEAIRRAQFLLAEVPLAAVRQHLLRGEPPPKIVDDLIRTTFDAVVRAYRRGD